MAHGAVRIAKNTTYLTLAYVVQKVFSFLYFILIARFAGVEDIGKYVFALSFTTMVSIGADLGLSSVVTREGAKEPQKIGDYLRSAFIIKGILAVGAYIVAVGGVMLLGKGQLMLELVSLAGLVMVLDSFSLLFYATWRARQNLRYEALGIIVGQVLIVAAGAAALITHASLHWLIVALLLGSGWNAVYSFWLVWPLLRQSAGVQWSTVRWLGVLAAPFAIAGIFTRVYSSLDAVLLSTLAGDAAVGWYSAGYKITFALQFIPMAFSAAIYPAMSHAFANDQSLLARTFERSFYYLALIALPTTMGIFVLAEPIIRLAYGEAFLPTALALQVLVVSLVFNFLGFPIGALLNATNRQTVNTINLGATLVVNAVLNVVLITRLPDRPYLGAAIAALVSSVVLFSTGFWWVKRIVVYNRRWLGERLGKCALAAAVMTATLVVLRESLSVVVLIPLGAVIDLGVLWLIGGVDRQDIQQFLASFRRSPVGVTLETGREE